MRSASETRTIYFYASLTLIIPKIENWLLWVNWHDTKHSTLVWLSSGRSQIKKKNIVHVYSVKKHQELRIISFLDNFQTFFFRKIVGLISHICHASSVTRCFAYCVKSWAHYFANNMSFFTLSSLVSTHQKNFFLLCIKSEKYAIAWPYLIPSDILCLVSHAPKIGL